jgi:hypothetical protein
MKQPWFGVKRYGIGVGPRSPAGWAAIAVYAVLMLACPWLLGALHAPRGAGLLLALALTFGLIGLMSATSDGRTWRWRDRE